MTRQLISTHIAPDTSPQLNSPLPPFGVGNHDGDGAPDASKVTAMDLLGIAPDWPTDADETKAVEERGYRKAIAELRYMDRLSERLWQANTAALDPSYRIAADWLEARLNDGGLR